MLPPQQTTATPEAAGGAPGATPPEPLPEAAFAKLLETAELDQLDLLCARILQEANLERLRRVQAKVAALQPIPDSLSQVLNQGEVLLRCRAPQAALDVLDRFGPGPGQGRVRWLQLQWRAATAALDHRRASLALERLGGGELQGLDSMAIPIRLRDDGTQVSRSAKELLMGHLEARGFRRSAAQVLLSRSQPGMAGAELLLQNVQLLEEIPAQERDALLETALEQAAAEGAWGLVSELLDVQAALPSSRALERRLRLSPSIDDAYGEWRLRRQDPAAEARSRELERQLRSPRDAGGHAATPVEPTPRPQP